MDNKFSVIFMGTPEFAINPLKRLYESENVVAVITQPDKPSGRGKKLQASAVKQFASKLGLSLFQPETLNDESFIAKIKESSVDLIVVVAYGKILPNAILNLPRFGAINIHASLLPKYRGAAPIQRAIINGEKRTGVTIMVMDEGLDTGDILAQKVVDISQDETAGELHDRLSELGASLLIDTINKIRSGDIKRQKQDHQKATYAPPIKKEDCLIDWEKDSISIHNLIRGLSPKPGAYTFMDKKIFRIYRSRLGEKDIKGKPGEVVKLTKDAIGVATRDGVVYLLDVQLQNRKRMPVRAFLSGTKISLGFCFG